MVRLFNATTARLLVGAETWLCSLGITLLALSVLLVPTSRLLADDGGTGPLIANDCKPKNACENGCTWTPPDSHCTPWRGNTGCTRDNNCSACYCTACVDGQGQWCGCQCMFGNSGCETLTKCNPN
jgi:hypothetical protein